MLAFLLHSELDDEPIAFAPPKWVSIVAVVSVSLTLWLAILIYLGVVLAGLWALAFISAGLIWYRLGYLQTISRRAIPGLILIIVANLVLGAELYSGSYAEVLSNLFPGLLQPANILTSASISGTLTLTASAVWLGGCALVFYHVRMGGFVALALTTWSLIFPLSLYVLPLFSTARLLPLPGAVTGVLVAVLAGMALVQMRKTSFKQEIDQ